jgi:hypothetical protein
MDSTFEGRPVLMDAKGVCDIKMKVGGFFFFVP